MALIAPAQIARDAEVGENERSGTVRKRNAIFEVGDFEPGIADLDNAPGFGFAGSVTAALFLRRFVTTGRYLHFDIYGHTPADQPARPKGGAGQGARAVLCALPSMLGL